MVVLLTQHLIVFFPLFKGNFSNELIYGVGWQSLECIEKYNSYNGLVLQ